MLKVVVLGTGCAKCNKLFDEAKKAIETAGVEADLTKVEKIDEIMNYGVMMTPGLVINGQVKASGKIPKSAQIITWLNEAE